MDRLDLEHRIEILEEENRRLRQKNKEQEARIKELLSSLLEAERNLEQLAVFSSIYETNAHYDNIHTNLEISLTDIASSLRADEVVLFQKQDDGEFHIINTSIKNNYNYQAANDELLYFIQQCRLKRDLPQLASSIEVVSEYPSIIRIDDFSTSQLWQKNRIVNATFIQIITSKEIKYVLGIINPSRRIDDTLLGLISVAYADTLARIEKENLTHTLSITDNMTGVYNRRYFNIMRKSFDQKGVSSIGVIMADLFRLKHVNDTLGHEAGDIYIKAMVELLTKYFKQDMIFRLGGDEFLIIVVDKDYKYIDDRLNDLYADIDKLNLVDNYGNPIFTRIDTGVEYAYGDFEFDTLIRTADLRMNENKNKYYREKGIDRRK